MSVSQNARDTYLESQVLTATPQKLRLMLIDGAIRFALAAQESWSDDEPSLDALEAIDRCRNITSELLSSVRGDDELSQRVASLYLFLYRELSEIQLLRDRSRIAAVIDVLEIERQTWQQFCEQNPDPPDPEAVARMRPSEVTAREYSSEPAQPDSVPPPRFRWMLEQTTVVANELRHSQRVKSAPTLRLDCCGEGHQQAHARGTRRSCANIAVTALVAGEIGLRDIARWSICTFHQCLSDFPEEVLP